MTAQLSSLTNSALSDLRDDWRWIDLGWPDDSMSARIINQEDYLSDGFGYSAANDGIYTVEEIEHGRTVLNRLIDVYGLEAVFA